MTVKGELVYPGNCVSFEKVTVTAILW